MKEGEARATPHKGNNKTTVQSIVKVQRLATIAAL